MPLGGSCILSLDLYRPHLDAFFPSRILEFHAVVLGLQCSGITEFSEIFVVINPVGVDYFSGGAYGLEGSIIGIATRFLVLALVIGSCKWMSDYNPQLKENQYGILPQALRFDSPDEVDLQYSAK